MTACASDATDLLVLDDLVDHPIEVTGDMSPSAGNDPGTDQPGNGDGHEGSTDAIATVNAGEEQGTDESANREEDAGQRLCVRAHLRGNDRERRDVQRRQEGGEGGARNCEADQHRS